MRLTLDFFLIVWKIISINILKNASLDESIAVTIKMVINIKLTSLLCDNNQMLLLNTFFYIFKLFISIMTFFTQCHKKFSNLQNLSHNQILFVHHHCRRQYKKSFNN